MSSRLWPLLLSAVVCVDALFWVTRNTKALGMPVAYVILVVCCVVALTWLAIGRVRLGHLKPQIEWPQGKKYRAGSDDAAIIRQAFTVLSNQIDNATRASSSELKRLHDYINSLHAEWAQQHTRDAISQRNQAIITTTIGLVGGFVGSILASGIH